MSIPERKRITPSTGRGILRHFVTLLKKGSPQVNISMVPRLLDHIMTDF
jgi:hypothetical protein